MREWPLLTCVCVSLHCSSAGEDGYMAVFMSVVCSCILVCMTVPVVLLSPVSRLIGSMEVETNYMFCFLWTSSINQRIMRESTMLHAALRQQSNGGKRLKCTERASASTFINYTNTRFTKSVVVITSFFFPPRWTKMTLAALGIHSSGLLGL